MMNRNKGKVATTAVAAALAFALAGCGAATNAATSSSASTLEGTEVVQEVASQSSSQQATMQGGSSSATQMVSTLATSTSGALDTSDLFSERDLVQTADTTGAQQITLKNGENVTISEEGVYLVSGSATNTTIYVDADSSAKVQIVLDGASISNESAPAIYVRSADKVFVTTAAGSQNTLEVTGSFAADGETNLDAAIFSKDDLTLNGEGSLIINSTANGVTSKDDLKVTGGNYQITATGHGLEGKDSVRISDGDFVITAGKDGIHAENSDDDTLGYVYVGGGNFTISSSSDGVRGTTVVQIDDGTFSISSAEGIESTYVQINGGTIGIAATDDAINATTKSAAAGTPTIDIRGGEVSIEMAQGDTDALDANGNIYISGGVVNISAQFAFDFDGEGQLSGGEVYVNGEQVTSISNSMMGGMGGGPGQMGEMGGDPSQMGQMGGDPSQMGGDPRQNRQSV